MNAREALIALNLIQRVGPVRLRQLLGHFTDPPSILTASLGELRRVPGIGDDTAQAIAEWESTTDLTRELRRIEEYGCHVLTQEDEAYPTLLRQIYDPPIVLYVKGQLRPEDRNAVALVGSRRATPYGQEMARRLSYQLAYVGVTVVSGGARGIDTAAHQGALQAKGRTIAVLGNGINIVVPIQITQNESPSTPFCMITPHRCGLLQSAPPAALLAVLVGRLLLPGCDYAPFAFRSATIAATFEARAVMNRRADVSSPISENVPAWYSSRLVKSRAEAS